MKTGILALSAFFAGTTAAQASALVQRDEAKGIMRFITQINYQGSAATDEVALASTTEIARMWNEAKAEVSYYGRVYKVEFVLGYTVNSIVENFMPSDSCGLNTVQIEPKGDRSFYSLFGRQGTFYLSDDLGKSTTTAHEYGHGLGLEHDDGDQRAADVPGIMFARGTLVKSKYQWNPTAEAGMPGGTLNPKYRHVRAADIAKLDLSRLSFTTGYACLGEGRPIKVAMSNVIKVVPAAKPAPKPVLKLEGNESYPSPTREEEIESELHDH